MSMTAASLLTLFAVSPLAPASAHHNNENIHPLRKLYEMERTEGK